MQTTEILIANIIDDPAANVRLDMEPDQLADLAADIEAHGLRHPITVRRRPEGSPPWDLVAGFRRVAACRSLGWKTIPATEFVGDDAARLVAQIAENVKRENLTTFEIATACARLRGEHGKPAPAIAGELGFDERYVQQLLRCLDRLDAAILHAWRRRHPAATLHRLRHLAAMPPLQQREAWAAVVGMAPATPAEPRGRRPPPARRPPATVLSKALLVVKKSNRPDDWKAGAEAALRYAAGETLQLGTLRATSRRTGRKRKVKAS